MHNTSLWIGLGACAVVALIVALTALGSKRRRGLHGGRSSVSDPGGYYIAAIGDGGGHSGGHGSCDGGSGGDGGSSGGGGDCGGAS